MQLRNGALAGGSPGQLQADRRPAFEEGVLLVFKRWTALCLALDGQWGGSGSADKAQIIYEETLDWFYKKKGMSDILQCCPAFVSSMCSTDGMTLKNALCQYTGCSVCMSFTLQSTMLTTWVWTLRTALSLTSMPSLRMGVPMRCEHSLQARPINMVLVLQVYMLMVCCICGAGQHRVLPKCFPCQPS